VLPVHPARAVQIMASPMINTHIIRFTIITKIIICYVTIVEIRY